MGGSGVVKVEGCGAPSSGHITAGTFTDRDPYFSVDLSGTVEVTLYSVPSNGDKQYVIESPCATVSSGVVRPVPQSTVSACNKIQSSTASDSRGISLLFQVDSSSCGSPDALSSAVFPVAPVVGGTVGGVIALFAAVVVVVVLVYRHRKNEEKRKVQAQIGHVKQTMEQISSPSTIQPPRATPPAAPASASPQTYWSASPEPEPDQYSMPYASPIDIDGQWQQEEMQKLHSQSPTDPTTSGDAYHYEYQPYDT